MVQSEEVDSRFYQVAKPGSLAERITAFARDGIYDDFLRLCQPKRTSTIIDVGVSDVVGEAANVLERKYPYLHNVTAVGLGSAHKFQTQFPNVAYQQIEAGNDLPFSDKMFDIATSNAVLEHVGSMDAQLAFVAELMRVARKVFISVPHRYFPIEHHTGIPIMHWSDRAFDKACRFTRKEEWSDRANLIMMTKRSLKDLSAESINVGYTGIRIGPFSSNLYLFRGVN